MPQPDNLDPADRRRIAAITTRLARTGLICSGTLMERTKTCGKPNCRCATDPDARHGPYYEWSWKEGGTLRHKILSRAQALRMRRAIRDYRTVQRLLERWERESAAILLGTRSPKS